MTDTQNSYLEMLNMVISAMDKYSAAWSGNADCAASKAAIVAAVAGMRQCIAGQSEKLSAINKQEAREALEVTILRIADGLVAYATKASDADLLRDSKITARGLYRATEKALLGISKQITDLATAHPATLAPYGITAAMVDDCVAKSTAFSAQMGAPAAQKRQRGLHTTALENYRKAGLAACNDLDPLIKVIGYSSPEFAHSYFEARRLRKVGHRKRALQVRVTSTDGKPVANAMITIAGLKVKRKASDKGQAYIQHLPEGEHKMVIDAAGYARKEVPVFISTRERMLTEVKLEVR